MRGKANWNVQVDSDLILFVGGLPEHLLTPTSTADLEDKFHSLQLEETAASSADSTLMEERRKLMTLNLDDVGLGGEQLDEGEGRSGIIFSPGGSEAYVFTGSAAAEGADTQQEEKESSTPREINDPIFVEKDPERKKSGKAADPAAAAFDRDNRRSRKLVQNYMQERLDDFRSTMEKERQEMTSAASAASPLFAHRRVLPNLPLGGAGFEAGLSEHEFASSVTDDSSLPSPSPRMGLGSLHRATSPSAASVASSTASGLTTGRKNLEWDSGADLGYLDDLHQQPGAAASLSTLEKMAIGSYSNIFGSEVSKSGDSRSKQVSRRDRDLVAMQENLRARQRKEDEMRQDRLHKFADSLMKQRDLRKMASEAASKAGEAAKKKSSSRESLQRRRSPSVTPDSSPSRRSERPRRRHSPSASDLPVKSHSLTDLKAFSGPRPHVFSSNTDLSRLPSDAHGHHACRMYGSSEPTSVSSTGTVVPVFQDYHEREVNDLQDINTDPTSLPKHVQVSDSRLAILLYLVAH